MVIYWYFSFINMSERAAKLTLKNFCLMCIKFKGDSSNTEMNRAKGLNTVQESDLSSAFAWAENGLVQPKHTIYREFT